MGEKMPSRKDRAAVGERPARGSVAGTGEEKASRKRGAAVGSDPPRGSVVGVGEEKASREAVAGAGEVLEYLTCVLRGEEDGEQKNASARMKAAELLGKRMGLFEEGAEAVQEPVVIIDDVREAAGNAGTAAGPGGIAGGGLPPEQAARLGGIVDDVREPEEGVEAAGPEGIRGGARVPPGE